MSTLGLGLGLVLVPWAGGLAAWRLWPGRAKPLALLAGLAWPLGLALTSSAYFLWLVGTGGRAGAYAPFEGLALLAATGLAWRAARARGEHLRGLRGPRTWLERAAGLVLLAAAVLAVLAALRIAAVTPWGYWDAWARINLKARFLAEGGPHWTWIFRGADVPHHDYPLLVECSVARLWRWSGRLGASGFPALAPQALALVSWVACLAALCALARELRSPAVAALAGLAFLCKQSDGWWAAMQYADFALATLFVAGAGLVALAARRRRLAAAWWPLCGACAAAAAWCKNEGLVFAGLLVVCALVAGRAGARLGRRGAGALASGLAAGGLAWLVLKLGFAARSSLLGPRERGVLEDLADGSRYRALGAFAARHLREEWMGWALGLLALSWLLAPLGRAAHRSLAPLALCLALALAYALVLLTTREDLAWHLGTVADRLLLQLWPLAILGAVAAWRRR